MWAAPVASRSFSLQVVLCVHQHSVACNAVPYERSHILSNQAIEAHLTSRLSSWGQSPFTSAEAPAARSMFELHKGGGEVVGCKSSGHALLTGQCIMLKVTRWKDTLALATGQLQCGPLLLRLARYHCMSIYMLTSENLACHATLVVHRY
jgi:hypothetical protein